MYPVYVQGVDTEGAPEVLRLKLAVLMNFSSIKCDRKVQPNFDIVLCEKGFDSFNNESSSKNIHWLFF